MYDMSSKNYKSGHEHAIEALKYAREIEKTAGEEIALHPLVIASHCLRQMERFDEARVLYKKAVKLAVAQVSDEEKYDPLERKSKEFFLAELYTYYALTHIKLGNYGMANNIAIKAVDIFEENFRYEPPYNLAKDIASATIGRSINENSY